MNYGLVLGNGEKIVATSTHSNAAYLEACLNYGLIAYVILIICSFINNIYILGTLAIAPIIYFCIFLYRVVFCKKQMPFKLGLFGHIYLAVAVVVGYMGIIGNGQRGIALALAPIVSIGATSLYIMICMKRVHDTFLIITTNRIKVVDATKNKSITDAVSHFRGKVAIDGDSITIKVGYDDKDNIYLRHMTNLDAVEAALFSH